MVKVCILGRRSASASRALTTAPICLTWGEGTEGQLGHFPFTTSGVMKAYVELEPRQLEGAVFGSVSCGTNHTLAVDGDGQCRQHVELALWQRQSLLCRTLEQ